MAQIAITYNVSYIETDCVPKEVDKHMLYTEWSTKTTRKSKMVKQFLKAYPKALKVFNFKRF